MQIRSRACGCNYAAVIRHGRQGLDDAPIHGTGRGSHDLTGGPVGRGKLRETRVATLGSIAIEGVLRSPVPDAHFFVIMAVRVAITVGTPLAGVHGNDVHY